jgi:hypothetical protein
VVGWRATFTRAVVRWATRLAKLGDDRWPISICEK